MADTISGALVWEFDNYPSINWGGDLDYILN